MSKPDRGERPPRNPNDDAVKQMLENQRLQIKNEDRELQLKQRQLDKAHEYNMAALKAQSQYLADTAKEKTKNSDRLYIAVGVFLFMTLAFFCYTLYLGKEDFALDVIKTVVPPTITAVVGYLYGKSGKKNKGADDGYTDYTEVPAEPE